MESETIGLQWTRILAGLTNFTGLSERQNLKNKIQNFKSKILNPKFKV